MSSVPFGPTGQVVYDRTYSRPKPDGTKETWPETVDRVVRGNLALVHGDDVEAWPTEAIAEATALADLMLDFKVLPAGRHLWASGVKGRQYLFNCHVAGWEGGIARHAAFTFLRLMEGGGVGANYSSRFLEPFGAPRRALRVHVVCDPSHPDYEAMVEEGLLSEDYASDWDGAYLVEDSREGWAMALVDLIETHMTDDLVRHADRVYDVTNVRPKGSRLKTFGGTASGPGPFARMLRSVSATLNDAHRLRALHLTPVDAMDIDHAIAECVVSGGSRRSARMAIVAWDDPYVEEFLACKADGSRHWTTNISVEVNEDFRRALAHGDEGDLAQRVFRRVVEGMLTNGEPGLWDSSLSNVGEVGEVIATNPCGEIALEAWENCNLGHVNLDAFADDDIEALEEAHRLVTRFLMRATYGDVNDQAQAERLAANRRIGVGHFGVQGYLVKRGVRYSEAPRSAFPVLLGHLYRVVRDEARQYAFHLRIPEPVKVTTVAPTGTIAKMPGATEGIHPIYARHFIRRVRFTASDPDQAATLLAARIKGYTVEPDVYDPSGNTMVVEYPTKDLLVAQVEERGQDPALVEAADEVSVEDMLAFQAMYQEHYADNAVSFTVNVPASPAQEARLRSGASSPGAPEPEDVERVLEAIRGVLGRVKGTTLMVDGTRPQAPYERLSEADWEAYASFAEVADGIDEECASGACPVR